MTFFRHLISSRAITNQNIFSEKTYLSLWVRNMLQFQKNVILFLTSHLILLFYLKCRILITTNCCCVVVAPIYLKTIYYKEYLCFTFFCFTLFVYIVVFLSLPFNPWAILPTYNPYWKSYDSSVMRVLTWIKIFFNNFNIWIFSKYSFRN